MSKISFSQEQLFAQKDLERILWEVFWSYSKELGLEESEEIKNQRVAEAQTMIPDFAESAAELELYMDYPVIHLFLTSLHLKRNFLQTDEVKKILEIKGPDNNAKLALLVRKLKENGVLWQYQQ